MWAKPKPDITPTIELVSEQNQEVEADIMFFEIFSIWHMLDRADRWHAGRQIFGKTSDTLQEAIDLSWLQVFGPFKRLIIDGEKGVDSESTRAFLKRNGIELVVKAKGQHARMIERRGAILRHTMHTMKAQLAKENITVTFGKLLANAIFAGNALTNVGGGTPCNARLG